MSSNEGEAKDAAEKIVRGLRNCLSFGGRIKSQKRKREKMWGNFRVYRTSQGFKQN